jgi:hypothetical protein
MTLTIKEQIDGLLAYAKYQEAQAKALCDRHPGVPSEWIAVDINAAKMNAIHARREARILQEQNNA